MLAWGLIPITSQRHRCLPIDDFKIEHFQARSCIQYRPDRKAGVTWLPARHTPFKRLRTRRPPFTHVPFFRLLLNILPSNGSLSPIHVACCVWFLNESPSSVLGWIRTLNGPLLITSQGIKAPNWAGVKMLTSNIAMVWGPTGLSQNL